MALICPLQCVQSPAVSALLDRWILDQSNPIRKVHYCSLDQSMKNGGGPGCLRLRAMLDGPQIAKMGNHHRVTDHRIEQLRSLVVASFSGALTLSDLVRLDFAEQAIATAKKIAALSKCGWVVATE